MDCILHNVPNLVHIVKKIGALLLYCVLPNAHIVGFAVVGNIRKSVQIIYVGCVCQALVFVENTATTNAHNTLASNLFALGIADDVHGVGVRYVCGGHIKLDVARYWRKSLYANSIRAVTFPRL